jgi:ferredoxin-type protein NapH
MNGENTPEKNTPEKSTPEKSTPETRANGQGTHAAGKTTTVKARRKKTARNRTLVFFAVVVIVAIGYFTNIGIGNVSAIGWDAWSVICPLGYVESLLAGKVFIPRALISFIAVVLLTIVLGRVLCAWICPMPFLQRWIGPAKRAKKDAKTSASKETGAAAGATNVAETSGAAGAQGAQGSAQLQAAAETTNAAEAKPALTNHGKPNVFKFDSRHGVLLGALASAAIFGFPVFCLICPVGLGFATVFLVMRLFAYGEVTWTVIVVPLVLILEVVFARSWCHKFCPLGAFLSLISGANKTLRPTINENKCLVNKGVHCYTCSTVCPEHLDIRRPESSERALSNCTKCKECAASCPAQAISYPLLAKRVNEGMKAEAATTAGGKDEE